MPSELQPLNVGSSPSESSPLAPTNGEQQGRKRRAVVTGGTRGIGLAVSLSLARSGYRVLAIYARNRTAAEGLTTLAREQGLEIECVRADLSHEDGLRIAIEEIKKRCPEVDVLVHSAASGVHRKVDELSVKQLMWTFSINLFAVHGLMLGLAPILARGGRVIGMTSRGSQQVGHHYAAVGSSKGALETLFRYYAHELAPRGVAVNMVCPGLVLTDAIDAFPEREHRIEHQRSKTPTGQLTTTEEVAAFVHFLCSPAAGQIVGQTLVIDGGRCLV